MKFPFIVFGLLLLSRMAVLSDVQITELSDKGYSITADNYTAACDATGMPTSLKVNGEEFLGGPIKMPGERIVPPVSVSDMKCFGTPQFPTGPATREGNTLRVQGKTWSLKFTYKPDTIETEWIDAPGLVATYGQIGGIHTFMLYPNVGVNLLLSSTLDRLADPLEQGDIGWSTTSNPEPGAYAVMAKDGAALVFSRIAWAFHMNDPTFIPPRMDVVSLSARPDEPEPAGATTVKRTIHIFPKPDLERSLEMKIISPNPDHLFSHATAVTFPIEVTAHYGQSFKGFLRFAGNNYVWTQDKVNAEVPVDVSPAHPTQTVNLVIHPPKPGHIIGKIIATDGTTIYNGKQIGFVFNPEQIPPVVPPKDFDAFWDDTMKQLDKVPLDLTLTEQKDKETPLGKVYLAKFRSWGGQWAWAWLTEPKDQTKKVDATLRCPPVSVYQPGPPEMADGTFHLAASVHGGDLTQYPAKPENGFDYMNGGLQSRDTAALRYSYCCLVRCYDIMKSRPFYNGTVHVVGGSQGGGLSFVLGGLRPITDISATNIALFRIDWSALGYVRWGPGSGPDPQKTAEILRYYDPACFMHRVHAPMILFLGLFDFTGPVQGIFTGINDLPKDTVCKVVIDPYGSHFTSHYEGRQDASKVVEIPRWQGSNADNKLNR